MCFSIYFEERPKLESSTSDPLWGAILDQNLAKIVPKMGTKNGQKTTPEFAMVSAPFLVTFGTLLGAQNGSQNCSANLRGRSGGTRWPSRTPPGPSVTHCELFLRRGGAFGPHSASFWRFLGVILVHFGVTLGPWWVRFGFVHCHVGAIVGFTPRTPHRNHTRTSHTTHTHKQDQAHTHTDTHTDTHTQTHRHTRTHTHI